MRKGQGDSFLNLKTLIMLTLLACSFVSLPSFAQIKNIIINPSVTHKSMNVTLLRSIFAMKRRNWDNGEAITVFVFNDASPAHITFCKKVLNVYPHQMRRMWDRLVYSGIGQAPVEVSSEAEMKHLIATTPGAIGYIMDHAEKQDGTNVIGEEQQ